MGRRPMRRPPKYVHGVIDRHGKPRFYFRRSGYKPVPLPGLPWAPQFMAAYDLAMRREWGSPQIGSKRTIPGTVNAAIISYYNLFSDFRCLAARPQATRRRAAGI